MRIGGDAGEEEGMEDGGRESLREGYGNRGWNRVTVR